MTLSPLTGYSVQPLVYTYGGTSFTRNRQPPYGTYQALGIGPLWGPRVERFLMSEVLLYGIIGSAIGLLVEGELAVHSIHVPLRRERNRL